jgi:hypothetical protein
MSDYPEPPTTIPDVCESNLPTRELWRESGIRAGELNLARSTAFLPDNLERVFDSDGLEKV